MFRSRLARRPLRSTLLVLATASVLHGCGADRADELPDASVDGPSLAVDSSPDSEATVDAPPYVAPVPPECLPPPGIPRSPRTIGDVVTLLNALRPPVSINCFLQSLQRPLYLNGTRSFISLQPASGTRSPRLFLMLDGLVLSIVPEGVGSPLLEFGQFVTEDRTLKAELKFPIVAPIAPAAPFHKPHSTSSTGTAGTTCRTCHRQEERAVDIDFAEAYVSGALRPDPRTRVDFQTLLQLRQDCTDDSDRCAMFRALFDHGEVLPRDFPAELPTIFD